MSTVLLLRVHLELRSLVHEQSAATQDAGIDTVDWWFRCIRGTWRLAFGTARLKLSPVKRRLFQAFVISNMLSAVLILACYYVAGDPLERPSEVNTQPGANNSSKPTPLRGAA